MRMLNNKGMKVVVLSSSGNGCPRMKITKNAVQIRDDYNGKVKAGAGMLIRLTV